MEREGEEWRGRVKSGEGGRRGRVEREGEEWRGRVKSGEGGGRVEREGGEWIGRVKKKGLHACFYIAIRET